MKIIVTITATEQHDTLEAIMIDPCIHIQCGEIDCEECPLHTAAQAFRRAQEDYAKVINKIIIEGD